MAWYLCRLFFVQLWLIDTFDRLASNVSCLYLFVALSRNLVLYLIKTRCNGQIVLRHGLPHGRFFKALHDLHRHALDTLLPWALFFMREVAFEVWHHDAGALLRAPMPHNVLWAVLLHHGAGRVIILTTITDVIDAVRCLSLHFITIIFLIK